MQPKVLLVYSDKTLEAAMNHALTQCGVDMVSVADLNKASALIDGEAFEAIFLDGPNLGAAGVDLETRVQTSARNGKTSVVTLTDYQQNTLRARLEHQDSTFVMDRPFNVEQFQGLLTAGHVHVPQVLRKHIRVPYHGQVVCDTEHEEFTAVAETISEGGLGLLVSGDVTMDTEWVVTFTLPGSKDMIEAKGRVRRTSETQVGLSFAKIHEADRDAIHRYAASQPR